jgi:hypothetical protein
LADRLELCRLIKLVIGVCETLKMNELCIHNSYNIEVSQTPKVGNEKGEIRYESNTNKKINLYGNLY